MSNNIPPTSCAICGGPLTGENESSEHAILESIGGRLKVKGFICNQCNSRAGHTWDAELATQLHPLNLLFGVDRQRGSTPGLPIVTTAGEELVIKAEGGYALGKPSYSETAGPGGVTIQITARSMREAKQMLAGVKRKFPNVDVDRILAHAQMSTSYPKGLIHHSLQIGGEVAGRSIVKSALAMAHHAGVPSDSCRDALEYLRNASESPCFGYYYATDLVTNRPAEVPLNCVSIHANPDTLLVLGYAEYFGIFRAVICLGRGYAGDRIQGCYAIDPRSGDELSLSVSLDFGEGEMASIYEYKMIPDGAMQDAFAKVMPAALRKKLQEGTDRVTREAAEYAMANCGAKPGEMLTEAHVKNLPRLMMEKLTPLMLHIMARRQIPTTPATSDPRAHPTDTTGTRRPGSNDEP
jgi:hypothetical protein